MAKNISTPAITGIKIDIHRAFPTAKQGGTK